MQNSNLSPWLKEHFFLHNHSRNAFFHPTYIAIIIGALLYGAYELFKYADIWSTWISAGGNSLHFCELNRDGMVIQPANTWSNLGYLFVGCILFSVGLKDHFHKGRADVKNLLAKYPAFTFFLAIGLIHLFIGSFFYHASLTQLFQIMDVTGIYAIILALFTYNAFKAFPLMKIGKELKSTHRWLIGIGVSLNLVFMLEIYKWNINYVFPVLIIALLVVNLINFRSKVLQKMYKNYIWLAMATMLAALSLWILDRTNVWCSPTSIFQGHALWHLLTALAVLLIYFYYRSEEFDMEAIKVRSLN